jgi:small subunit ribosomal protein S17e
MSRARAARATGPGATAGTDLRLVSEAKRRAGKVIKGAWVRRPRMGNIRQTYIKRVAIELIRHYPNEFTGDFANNKKKVLELTDLAVMVDGKQHVVYKKLANRIAGYSVRYVKRKRGV